MCVWLLTYLLYVFSEERFMEMKLKFARYTYYEYKSDIYKFI